MELEPRAVTVQHMQAMTECLVAVAECLQVVKPAGPQMVAEPVMPAEFARLET